MGDYRRRSSPRKIKAPVNFGITDVEPGALIGNNFPSAYATSVYGKATAAQLAGLSATTLFDQVFGIFVNTKGLNLSDTPLSLSAETITSVLQGGPGNTDWHSVPDSNGKPVTTASQPIVIVNREQGAGTRTATDIFFTTDECNKLSVKPIKESTGGTADAFSTGNALAAANSIPGSITYATIDYADSSQYPNLTLVNVNGVVPGQLNAAAGTYSDWFEATGVVGSGALTADQQSLINYLVHELQTQSALFSPTAQIAAQNDAFGYTGVISVQQPLLQQILANANYNTAALPISSTNDGRTYINPFTRSGNSCNAPIDTL